MKISFVTYRDNLKYQINQKFVSFAEILIKQLEYLKTKYSYVRENSLPFTSLSPINNADPGGHYQASLLWALNNRKKGDIKNIALTGPYGSGKSSILKTFIENYKGNEYHFLPISLATFKEEEDVENNPGKEELLRLIEVSILQQIFYRERDNRIPDSRFRKIKRYKRRERVGITFLSLLFVCVFVQLAYPQFLNFLFQTSFSAPTIRTVHFIALVIAALLLTIFIYKSVRTISGLRINKVQIQNAAEIGFDDTKNKSVLNHHLDEILYFFEVTNYNVVIIEDLDRFRQTEIFTKLREINLLINQSKKVNKDVVFIYAVRDDMFRAENERTKFFDFIIPVIPVINSSNSSDMLMQRQNEHGWHFSEDLIDSLSLFIDDMRLLYNITNEYYLYHQKLNKNLNQDKLLAILVYKNLFPNDFTALTNNEGVLYNAIQSKKIIVEKRKKILIEEKQIIKVKVEELEKVRTSDINELRLVYLSYYPKHLSNFVSFQVGYINYNLEEAIAEEIFEIIRSDKASYASFSLYHSTYFTQRVSPVTVKFATIENEVNTIYTYKQREDLINEVNSNKVELLKKRIREIDVLIDQLRFLQIAELLQEETYELAIDNKEQKALVYVLLRNGFINEDYFDYISLFYEGSITQNDQHYLLHVKSQKALPFDHLLNKIDRVVMKINPIEFKHGYVLNYQLIDFIISEDRFKIQVDNLFMQLQKGDELSVQFINGFIDVSKKLPFFIRELVRRWQELWSFIEQQSNYTAERKHFYLKLIIAYAEVNDIVRLLATNTFRRTVLRVTDFLQIIPDREKLKDIINRADLKFTDLVLEESPEDLLQYIFNNSYYEINEKMLRLMLKHKNSYDVSAFNSKNYSAIIKSKQDRLIQYVDSHINDYIQNVYIKLLSNVEEEEVALVRLLNHAELTLKSKELLLKHVRTIITDLSDIEESEVKSIIVKENKFQAIWANVADYFLANEYTITQALIDYLNVDGHTVQLIKTKLPKGDGEDDLYQQLAESIVNENDINDECYNQLITTIGGKFDSVNFDSLSDAKVKMLIQQDMILFDSPNYLDLKSSHSPLHILFIERNVALFLNNIEELQLDVRDVLSLLQSTVLNLDTKGKVISVIDEDTITNDKAVVLTIMAIITTHQRFTISNTLLKAMLVSEYLNAKDRIRLFLVKLEQATTNDITDFLKGLGVPYADITIPGKRPLLENNQLNYELLNILESKRYISSFSQDHKDGLRVNTPKGRSED